MKTKIILIVLLLTLCILAWAPWMDNQSIHDMILREKGRKDGTIQPVEDIVGNQEALEEMRERSRKQGITDGILICDYKVSWFPFGRLVGSCEGIHFVTFYGEIML